MKNSENTAAIWAIEVLMLGCFVLHPMILFLHPELQKIKNVQDFFFFQYISQGKQKLYI